MSQTVQAKENQPERETSEQSSQDLQGTSQNKTTNDVKIVTLHSDEYNNFKCPICLDILRSTRITKSCLHRFCKDCIITALRLGNKECPVCRRKLISKRSLDPEPELDELIRKMFPGCNEKDSPRQKPLGKKKYKTNRASSLTSERGQEITTTKSVHQGEEQQNKAISGLESNNDSLPCCSNASTHSSEKAGPSKKRAKTTEFEHDSKLGNYDSVTDGATELETILPQSLRGEDYPSHTIIATTSGAGQSLPSTSSSATDNRSNIRSPGSYGPGQNAKRQTKKPA